MAQAKDSPLVHFDESEIKGSLNRTVKEAVKDVFEALLEAEAAELLQARACERTNTRRDHRNGKRKRKLVTRVGEMELTVPRLRTIHFQSQTILNLAPAVVGLPVTPIALGNPKMAATRQPVIGADQDRPV